LGIGATGVAIFVFSWSDTREKAYFESDVGRACVETEAILAARKPPPKVDKFNRYVPRRKLEAGLEAYLEQPESEAGAYLVVYGARGAGKTTLVEHVLSRSGAGIVVVQADNAEGADLETAEGRAAGSALRACACSPSSSRMTRRSATSSSC
jgi:hypothetical protein